MVKPKKHLGQHFLTEQSIAERIVNSMDFKLAPNTVEIGPGTGVLTKFLNQVETNLYLCEIDEESIDYLNDHYANLSSNILEQDFLKFELDTFFNAEVNVIGNFPYNISSQILFRVFKFRDMVPQVVGMFQKEVAQRVASTPGNKTYGILSVVLQAFYDIEYLFTVKPGSFNPPPKVDSGVIRLTRKVREPQICQGERFLQVVKLAFNQRRKTLKNALKTVLENADLNQVPYLDKRAEQLDFRQFEELTFALFKSE